MSAPRNWFWIDLETSGLNPLADRILEVAVVITTENLEEIFAEKVLIAVPEPEKSIEKWGESAVEIHMKSGLIEELLNPNVEKMSAAKLTEWLETIAECFECVKTDEYKGSPLCGSSVHFDRAFLQTHAPGFLKRLMYRNIDVSTLHELSKAWFTSYHQEPKEPPHRALDDVRFSVDRLRWYRAHHFNPHGRRAA